MKGSLAGFHGNLYQTNIFFSTTFRSAICRQIDVQTSQPTFVMERSHQILRQYLESFSLVTRKIKEIVDLNLPIDIIAPSHGAIWRDNPLQIVEKYVEWADNYQEDQITIAYDTMWDGTARIAHEIAREISKQSPDTVVKVFNVAKMDKNEIMTEVFKSKAIAVGSPTVGNDILSSVAGWMAFLKSLKFKNKKGAAFGCYGWSGESVKVIKEKLADAGFAVVEPEVKSQWNPSEADFATSRTSRRLARLTRKQNRNKRSEK